MLRSTSIDSMMTAVLLELMPMNAKGPNPELWAVFKQLQEWKVAMEWKYSGIGTDRLAEIAESILKKLRILPDQELTQAIERVVKRHTLAHERQMKNAACGRVIDDWQVKQNEKRLPTNVRSAAATATPVAENSHITTPAA